MASKKCRSTNWSLAEISTLTDFVERNENVLKAKHSNLITNAKKAAKWQELTTIINSMGVQKRTIEQVKFKWGNLQQGAKRTFSEARKLSKMTGGGPPPKPPTAAEEKIIEMMKDRPNFSGIVGGFQSSMPPLAVALNTPALEKSPESVPAAFTVTEMQPTDPEESVPAFTVTEMQPTDPEESVPAFTVTEMSQTADPADSVLASLPAHELTCSSNCESNQTASQSVVCETVERSEPKRRKKISHEELQKMQYEVLRSQKTHFDLQNMKLKKELERADMEEENLRLRNVKLAIEIECLKQTVNQNESALLALQAIHEN